MKARVFISLILVALGALSSCEADGDRHQPPMNIVTSDQTIVHERVLAPTHDTVTRETVIYNQQSFSSSK
ncbi:MAG: hypothetical protein JWO08_3691 [Verrucomicrobiaceae bacterium]|nr:hypothetical protein [Verrucomicrobiaceae bacterium]